MAKKKRKGFNRSQKAWEESIAAHIGKIIDNASVKELENLVLTLFCAYGGYEASRKLGGNMTTNLGVAGSAALAFKLAKQPNMVAGASGVAYLASLGLINIWNPLSEILGTMEYPWEPGTLEQIGWGVPILAMPKSGY